jgi:predicted ATP-dependent serine protease
MPFTCRDCSYVGKQFAGGKCPACGSFDVAAPKNADAAPAPARKPFRLALLAAVWMLLGVVLLRRFFG